MLSREKFGWFVHPTDLGEAPNQTVTWIDHHVRTLGLPGIIDAPLATYDLLAAAAPTTVTSANDATPRRRGSWVVGCTWLTWRLSMWTVQDERSGRTVHAVLPTSAEPQFLEVLDAGAFDAQITRALRGSRSRTLLTNAQTSPPAWWTEVRPGALVPAERTTDGSVPKVTRRHARRDLQRLLTDARSRQDRGA